MQPFSGKKIIFGVSKVFGLNELFDKELKALGFEIIDISFHSHNFKYQNAFQHLKKIFASLVLQKKHYKVVLDFNAARKELEKKVEQAENVDYVLITRPDMYPIELIRKIGEKGGKTVAYQWDGLNNFPEVYSYIELFNRFFVFDGKDLKHPQVLPMTNFYPESSRYEELYDLDFQSDIVYIGSYSRDRTMQLSNLLTLFRELNHEFKYIFYSKRKKHAKGHNITITNKAISYIENLKYVFNSNVIVDLVCSSHTGLSFRVFESIGFGKKLITNNSKIADYDFYNSGNILVWKNQDAEEIKAFLEKPFSPYPQYILDKYKFSNWLRYALDIPQYIPLALPPEKTE